MKNKQQYLDNVIKNQEDLKYIISNYHPVNLTGRVGMKITALNAEAACNVVRTNIRKNFEGHPVTQFEEAIKERDTNKIYKLLSDTWFGVPESTDCWSIRGFRELVNLLDDYVE